MSSDRIVELELRLKQLAEEKQKTVEELLSLRAEALNKPAFLIGSVADESAPETNEAKVNLFLSLFRCRESVYPKLWENLKKGKKGYAIACQNEWVRGVCEKPRVKCSECPNQAFPKLNNVAVKNHLQGLHTIGTYAINENDTCVFLAADFDGDGWQKDVLAYKRAARGLGVDIHIERSRSGNGAHAWFFFLQPIPARIARKLGTLIVSKATEENHSLDLKTYDRFFPNQDFLPKGGFGNLIALPLQRKSREGGNTLFVDDNFTPILDQWEYLSQVKRLSLMDIKKILQDAAPDIEFSLTTQSEDASMEADERLMKLAKPKIFNGLFTGNIEIEQASQLSIKLEGLPGALVSAFKRTATFANPKFYELERLRFPTYPNSRFIFCGELLPYQLVLPRGVLEQCLILAHQAGAQVTVRDLRPTQKKLKIAFHGELLPQQKKATQKLSEHETGILVAPPGAGKTVMACHLISKRKLPTLILVHRQPLLDQWKEQISRFLEIPVKEIGTLGGSKKKLTGKIDIAMIQTLTKNEDIDEILASYGHIIIDECHHIPAVSFEAALKQSPAKYILGLTATPYRKDGHQRILFMQCGPVRHEMKIDGSHSMAKKVIVRETGLSLSESLGPRPAIHLIWEELIANQGRLKLVAQDAVSSVHEKRFPLIISDRKEHLEALSRCITSMDQNIEIFFLEGTLGKKARRLVMEGIAKATDTGAPICLLATASLIGEGTDIPKLDTLILAMPISFKGRIVQYAGRLHRHCPGKDDVVIYDYLDTCSGLTVSMYRKRVQAYRSMGYQIHAPEHSLIANRGIQPSLFR